MMHYTIAAALAAWAAITVAAQEPPVSAHSPKLADLAWMAGSWHGEGLGGETEEHWTAASGGTMMGAFRLVIDGKLRVIEFIMITQEENRIVYRFKHFSGDYTTWEKDAPLEFTLIEASPTQAIFHSEVPEQHSPRRISYRMVDDDNLLITVESSDESGNLREGFDVPLRRRPTNHGNP